MPSTKIRGESQIMDLSVDLGRLKAAFIGGSAGDWDITDGNADGTITGLATPTNPSDAATKQYVDNLMLGLAWKSPARVATTANVDLSTELENGDTVDGVTLATGDMVLVKHQSTLSQNGVYIVQETGAAVRDAYWNTGQGVANYSLFVEQGTVNGDCAFTVTNNSGSDVVGTDDLTFIKFASVVQQPTDVFDESPTVTDASDTVTLANTPIVAASERVYLNGVRQRRGAGNDYTINNTTGVITFASALTDTPGQLDIVVVDYRY